MIPSLKPPCPRSHERSLSRGKPAHSGKLRDETKHARRWWLRAVSALAVAYLVASQALMDLPGWSSSAFVLATLLAGVMVAGHYYGAWRLRVGKWVIIPLVFVGYCVSRAFHAVPDSSPLNVLLQVVSAFLGGFAVAFALKAGVQFKELVYAQVASGLLQFILILSGAASEPLPADEVSIRHAGITGNANTLALQLTLGACMIWMLPRKAGVIPCCFAFVSVAFALAVTGSRTAVLTACFFLLLVLVQALELLQTKQQRRVAILGILTAATMGVFVFPWLYQHSQELLAVQRTVDYNDSSFRTRADMIQQGLHLWAQAPIFGHGLDSFRGLSGHFDFAHNNYVELLSCTGLVGALLFYALHAQILVRAARAPRFLKRYCLILVVMVLLTDLACVNYKDKQTVMVLMLLTVVPTSRYAWGETGMAADKAKVAPQNPKQPPRRFILQK